MRAKSAHVQSKASLTTSISDESAERMRHGWANPQSAEWAEKAVPSLLQLGPHGNGKALAVRPQLQ
jgi:hypothetical protein